MSFSVNRNRVIDELRAIGLLAVILAHVSPPFLIMQVRTFDVPLMVLVSGISFGCSFKKMRLSQYFIHRLSRLLAPTWVFLCIYFLYFGCIEYLTSDFSISIEVVLKSFLLFNNGGIGYVWIVKVFILVALISPLLHSINRKTRSDVMFFIYLFFCFFIYFFFIRILNGYQIKFENRLLNVFMFEYLVNFIPYSLIFAVGLRQKKMNGLQQCCLLLFFVGMFGVFVLFEYSGEGILNLNNYKYPPRPLWVLYGCFMGLSLLMLLQRYSLRALPSKLIVFLSKNSIWIYLWHIFILKNWEYAISYIPNCFDNYLMKYFIVTFMSIVVTHFQKTFWEKIIGTDENNMKFNRVISIVFLK